MKSQQKCFLSALFASADLMLICVSARVFIPPSTRPCLPPGLVKDALPLALTARLYLDAGSINDGAVTLHTECSPLQEAADGGKEGAMCTFERRGGREGEKNRQGNERDASKMGRCRGECEAGRGGGGVCMRRYLHQEEEE